MFARVALSLIASFILLAVTTPPAASAHGSSLQLEGTLELIHGEDFDTGTAVYDYRLDTGRERVAVKFRGQAPDGFVNGSRVRIRGHRDGAGVFAADGGTSAGTVLATAPTWSTARRVAVVLINFSNNASKPFSRSFANGVVFTNANSVRAYFAEASGGAVNLTGTTFDWLRIPVSSATCDYRAWATAGKAGLAARGVDVDAYTNFMFVFPQTNSCAWRGLGYLPGPTTWINGAPSLRTSAHELMHNFGVHHASSLRCTANGVRVALSSNCTRSEYGDPFTTMGAASDRHAHGLERVQLGYLPASATRTVTTSGTYTLAKAFASSGVRVIGIPRGDGTWLYLEYRRPYGTYFDDFSTTSHGVRGVAIRLANAWNAITQSALIDTVPSTTTFNDAPLHEGRTFRDTRAGITITVTDLTRGSATIAIKLPADTTAPTPPTSLRATASTEDSIALAWSAATDNRAVTAYRVSRDGVAAGTVPGTTLAFTATGLAAGTSYDWTVRAIDAAGNVSTAASLRVATAAPDAAPSAVDVLEATVTPTTARLTWEPASDDHGVSTYRVWQDGVLLGSTAGTSYTASALQPSTAYSWTVRAVDTAGQVGAPATISATTAELDVTAPSPVTATIDVAGHGRITLRWTASSDDVAVTGYRIYRDGLLVETVAAGDRAARVSPGSTYWVTAVDAAGNESLPSNDVST